MGQKPPVTRVLGGEASGALNALAPVRASGGGQCPCARCLSVRSSPFPYSTAVVARALTDSLDGISVFEVPLVDTLDIKLDSDHLYSQLAKLKPI